MKTLSETWMKTLSETRKHFQKHENTFRNTFRPLEEPNRALCPWSSRDATRDLKSRDEMTRFLSTWRHMVWKWHAFRWCCCWSLLYSAILRFRADSLRSQEWLVFNIFLYFFIARFFYIHRSGVLTALTWLVPRKTAAISAQVLWTPFNHAPCHFMKSHIRKVYACLVVTCHRHFWQHGRGLLRATAVTRGWNGYRNKSQHRKLTLEKKILPPLLPGLEPATFRSRVRRSNHWAIPAFRLESSQARIHFLVRHVYRCCRLSYVILTGSQNGEEEKKKRKKAAQLRLRLQHLLRIKLFFLCWSFCLEFAASWNQTYIQSLVSK